MTLTIILPIYGAVCLLVGGIVGYIIGNRAKYERGLPEVTYVQPGDEELWV